VANRTTDQGDKERKGERDEGRCGSPSASLGTREGHARLGNGLENMPTVAATSVWLAWRDERVKTSSHPVSSVVGR
jgi:hypothetical protein